MRMPTRSIEAMVLTSLLLIDGAAAAYPWHPEAVKACAALNHSAKIEMMHGLGKIDGYSRNSGCGYVCGRRSFRWDNGPQGYGDMDIPGTSTQWPSTLNMAASFDPKLAKEWGVAMGEEFWAKGANIQEGPGANIARVMRNGRAFEYISGEDPALGAALVVEVIDGIQQNVMAITKHFMLNNQEDGRNEVNEIVDEVTYMELYGRAFEAAAARTAGIMCAYNRINGQWACEQEHTLGMLKGEGQYNFSGFVVSDWGATHSTIPAINRGLDIEMPRPQFFTQEQIDLNIARGLIVEADLTETCMRILNGYFNLPAEKRIPCGAATGPKSICIDKNVSTPEHKALARKIATETTVLLKNENNLLPLPKPSRLKLGSTLKLALIGKNAQTPYTAGGGSGFVPAGLDHVVDPVAAFGFSGADVNYVDGTSAAEAAADAAKADVAIVFGYAETGEGHDRANLSLADGMDDVISAVARAQPKTVVVLSVPGSILTPWRDAVPAILVNWLPGMQVGLALADVIFGDVPPQAKLPVTFPKIENEQRFTEEQYPGVNASGFAQQANYSEGQFVGYRWYDINGVAPAFPFGHGLTYGQFEYSDLSISGRNVSFTLERTAGAGCDVAQIYLAPPRDYEPHMPLKKLTHFYKSCEPKVAVTYAITDRDVSHWKVPQAPHVVGRWALTQGEWMVQVGPSSRDIRLDGHFRV